MDKNERRPVAGRDYPRDWKEFLEWFPDDVACAAYLLRLRWPDGFRCPKCDRSGEPYRSSRGRFVCPACRYQSTVIAGTVFEKTRTPLTTWFAAIWYLTNQKHGVSAMGLQRVLGFGSYQTAWTMLHKLRRAMIRPGRERLCGVVEVDETYAGGKEGGVRGRKTAKKAIIAIAVEVHQPRGFGRIRLRRVADVSARSLVPFVVDVVEPGSHVHTDGWKAYNELSREGYNHQKTVMSSSPEPAHVTLPGPHRVASLLKRWLLGTHQGAVRPKQLDYYLDEYTFRFNRRTSRARGLLFFRLLENAVAIQPTTYRSIRAAGP